MSTFKVEIEDLIGSVGDDTFLTDSVLSTAKEVIKALPIDKLWSVSETSSEITSQAHDVGEAKVIKVQRETGSNGTFANCTEVSMDYEDRVQDTDSMFYPSVTNPVYLLKNANVWVYPAPENSPNSMKITTVAYPSSITIGSASVGSGISSFPNEHEPLVVLGAATKGLQYLMARVKENFTGLSPVFVAPTMGSVGALTLPSAPTAPNITDTTVSFSASPPAYSKPTVTIATFPTLTWAFPVIPVAPSLQTTTVSFGQAVPTYIKPVFSEPAFPTIDAMQLPNIPNVPVDPAFTAPDIATGTIGSLGTAPTYTKPVQSFDIGQLETFLETNEDPELAQVQIGRLSQELGQYQGDMQNALNDFNKENAIYQTTVQEAIQNAQIKSRENEGEANLKLSKEQQEYSARLSKYQNDVGNYQAQVNKEVQRWTSEEFNKKIQEWQTKYNNRLGQYSSDIQNELNEFNKENVVYQAQLQVSIQNAQQEGSDDVQKLQKYQNEVSTYQAEVGKVVQNNQGQASEWQIKHNLLLQQYNSDIQNELNEFNKESAVYQAQLQVSLQNAQLNSEDDAQKLQKYNAEVTSYQTQTSAIVQKWAQEEWGQNFEKYSSDYARTVEKYNADVQKYGADLQKYNSEYQWYQDQYARLDSQYKQGLQLILAGSMPQDAQAGV